ncbi:hypothetical protein EDB19DRAFT_1910328 [Suillus lakei]|nr:hypothetical protein EDB19DRAFT_1910328 [Suillus lakei]
MSSSKSHKRPLPSPDLDSEEEVIKPQWQSKKLCRPAIIELDPASDEENDTIEDSDKSESEESEIEPMESIAKSLFGEVPTTIAGSHQKTPHHRRLATAPPSPKTTSSSWLLKTPPQPIWGSQFKPLSQYVPTLDPHMGLNNDKSFSEELILVDDKSNNHSHTLNIKPEPDSADKSNSEPHSTESSLQADPIARIVYSKTGSVQLTDQNIELHNVIQRGILEVKGYMAYEHSYPDLVLKNIYAWEILLKAAQYHSAVPIEKRMRIDNKYLSALTNLIDAHASLFRSDIKDVIRTILLAKKNGSSDNFKFTGNQFLDIYNHHVLLLGSIQKKAPVKYHKMMSDIYNKVHNTGGYDQDDSLSFLDLDGMEDE